MCNTSLVSFVCFLIVVLMLPIRLDSGTCKEAPDHCCRFYTVFLHKLSIKFISFSWDIILNLSQQSRFSSNKVKGLSLLSLKTSLDHWPLYASTNMLMFWRCKKFLTSVTIHREVSEFSEHPLRSYATGTALRFVFVVSLISICQKEKKYFSCFSPFQIMCIHYCTHAWFATIQYLLLHFIHINVQTWVFFSVPAELSVGKSDIFLSFAIYTFQSWDFHGYDTVVMYKGLQKCTQISRMQV